MPTQTTWATKRPPKKRSRPERFEIKIRRDGKKSQSFRKENMKFIRAQGCQQN